MLRTEGPKSTAGARGGDRVVGGVLIPIGALVGLFAAMAVWDRLFPVSAAVVKPNGPGPAALNVELYGRQVRNRTSPNSEALDAEADLWVAIPSIAAVAAGAALGGYAGWRLTARLTRPAAGQSRPAPDQAVDYDDALAPPTLGSALDADRKIG